MKQPDIKQLQNFKNISFKAESYNFVQSLARKQLPSRYSSACAGGRREMGSAGENIHCFSHSSHLSVPQFQEIQGPLLLSGLAISSGCNTSLLSLNLFLPTEITQKPTTFSTAFTLIFL